MNTTEKDTINPFHEINQVRKTIIRKRVIRTIIEILREDIPKHITGSLELEYSLFRVNAFDKQDQESYDSSFYRSVHCFVSNFAEVYQMYRPEHDMSRSVTNRQFLYRELVDQLEDFIMDI